MALFPSKHAVPAVLVISLVTSSSVFAFRLESSAGLGLAYTDNATLVPSNQIDDWIVSSDLWTHVSKSTGSWQADADLSWEHQVYLNDTYDDRDYVDLSAVSEWEQMRDRLTWKIEDYFTQIPIDSLGADTPDNRININIFRFGPNINLPVSPRHSISLDPYFSDYYYEDNNTDNQQYGLSAGWLYRIYPVMQVGLEGAINEVNYSDDLNADYTSISLHAVVSGTTARSMYAVGLGATDIDRKQFSDIDGMTGDLTWEFKLTGKSRLLATLTSDLTNSSDIFLSSSEDPDSGDFSNVQNSIDVLRDNLIRLEYRSLIDSNELVSRFNLRAWIELRDMDYKETLNDREIQDYGVEYLYHVSDIFTTGINGRYVKTDSTDIMREDEEYIFGGTMRYLLSRKLRCSFDLVYQKRDSTLSTSNYDEYRVFAGLEYAIGRRTPRHW